MSIAAGRLSFVLGLQGPCVSYDTACSAALVASHAALRALQLDECSPALSVGVNLMLLPGVGFSFAVAGMTSPTGRCHTFDAAADGYVRGEACCAAVLAMGEESSGSGLSLLGSCVRQDGKSASLTAPNGQAQQALLRAALADGGVEPAALSCYEAHGTGTPLGDPIEVRSLAAAVLAARAPSPPLCVGSLKANCGHAEPAAGLAGLLRLAAGLLEARAPPNAQLRRINPHVGSAVEGVACALPTQLARGLDAAAGGRGGVSSFGYSGTIAHAVLEAAPPSLGTSSPPPLAYARRRYAWREAPHPLLQRREADADGRQADAFSSPASGPLLALVADHVVRGRVVFPAAAYLEMARAACVALSGGGGGASLRRVFFLQPLVLDGGLSEARVRVGVIEDRFEVTYEGGGDASTAHCAGDASAASGPLPGLSLAAARASCGEAVDAASLYSLLRSVGLEYGPRYRTLELAAVSRAAGAAVGRLCRRSRKEGTRVHPADLDGSLHLSSLLAVTAAGETRLPFSVGEAALADASGTAWPVAEREGGGAVGVVVASGAASAGVRLAGFESRALKASLDASARTTAPTITDWSYAADWAAVPFATERPSRSVRVLFVGDRRASLAAALAESAARHAGSASEVELQDAGNLDGVVLVASPSAESALSSIASALTIVQWTVDLAAVPVWTCTHLTQPVASVRRSSSEHAGLWGFARTCLQEVTGLPLYSLDLDFGCAQSLRGAAELVRSRALVCTGGDVHGLRVGPVAENEAVCRHGSTHVRRLVLLRSGKQSSLDVAFAPLCELLDAHVSDATSALEDLQQVAAAHGVLDIALRHDIARALSGLAPSAIPKWHHRLLYEWCASIDSPVEPATYDDVLEVSPRLWPEVNLARRCAPQLASALLGTDAYQELLFPGGSMEMTLPVYEDAVVSRFYNDCLVAAVDSIVACLPDGRLLSVVEIGAGTGGTASSVLPRLQGVCLQYMFTDVSETFLNQAQRRFAEYAGFMRFELLNIDADPRLQGFASGSFDLAIATNVLHATPFMHNTMSSCRTLLCPGGCLLVNELLQTGSFAQTTFGLTDGWWLFASDPERTGQQSPLMTWEHWRRLLATSGFDGAHCMRGGAGALQAQAVIVAQVAQREHGVNRELQQGSHLFSGGLGGLGLLTARVLVESGAKRLVLTSRSGRVQSGSEADWSWLIDYASLTSVRCDVAEATSVRSLVAGVQSTGPPVCSVFHAAGVLADASDQQPDDALASPPSLLQRCMERPGCTLRASAVRCSTSTPTPRSQR